MSNIVTVIVTGETGSGKSAVMGEIEIALKALGITVQHADPEAWASEKGMTHADWASALEMYQPTVVLSEVNKPGWRWDRLRVCAAASAASRSYGQWIPQQWLDMFMSAYEAPRPEHAATGSPS